MMPSISQSIFSRLVIRVEHMVSWRVKLRVNEELGTHPKPLCRDWKTNNALMDQLDEEIPVYVCVAGYGE